MSQSPMTAAVHERETTTGERQTVLAEGAEERLLAALDDTDCRAILDATSVEALSASEIADACDLPLSTTYRKLELLTDAGLLGERTRISPSGQHPSEYTRLVEEVVISLDQHGDVEMQVAQRASTTQAEPAISFGGE